MNFRQFEQLFDHKYPLSVQQIRLQERNFAWQQLHIWEQKWRLHHLRRWRRIFPQITQYYGYQTALANTMYEPSYISLERALRYYNLIPEWVYMITSCTSKKTQQFDTKFGTFSYRSLVPRLLFGYETQTIGDYDTIRIATPEKALCDYIYLHPELNWVEDFEEMRINILVRQEITSSERLLQYALSYPKKTQRNIQFFLDYINSTS